MISLSLHFAEASSGIGAFNINLKSFIFQLITFIIVLWVFRRWVLPPILKTLDDRRSTIEQSLTQAKQTEQKLAAAEEKATQILQKARDHSDKALADANAQAKDIVSQAGVTAETQAQRIVAETQERLDQEHDKLHDQLRGELADLVVMTTEKVLRTKVNTREDSQLVEKAVKELSRG